MELEELKKRITETIELYDLLIDKGHMLIEEFETDKEYAEEFEDIDAALNLEKKIIKTRAELLANIDAQVRLKMLLI